MRPERTIRQFYSKKLSQDSYPTREVTDLPRLFNCWKLKISL
jgi:hypothetical protein